MARAPTRHASTILQTFERIQENDPSNDTRMKPFTEVLFHDRGEAGRSLAERLLKYLAKPNTVVLGLPRGGAVVAKEIARRLCLPLDILTVRKLGVPCQEELAMGAIAPDGVCVLNDDLIETMGIESDTIKGVARLEETELLRRQRVYRGDRPPLAITGMTVILVDDGIATGFTVKAAVAYLRQHDAARVVIAAPVIAGDTFRELSRTVDEVVAVTKPERLRSISEWYEDFRQTSDAEVCALLGSPGSDESKSGSE